MAYSYTEAYRAFRARQNQLVTMLRQAQDEVLALNMPQQAKALRELEAKVRSDGFKIQVTGTFKNGKSTFINAFLGEEILPAYALPCTAVINEVRYGKEKKAVLYFRDPLPERLPEGIPGPVMAHMRKHAMKSVPPVIIPYEQIEQFVVIPMGADPNQMLLESPYEKVVLYWPLPLLAQGVQLIDSPGLNEHATRTRVTMDHLSKADAILFVLSAQALCSKEEMSFLENSLAAQGFHDPIFVVNRFDCIPERERPVIRRYAHQKLEKYTSYGAKGIFFTSALEALEAKKSRDDARLRSSGMVQLELALSDYLVRQKGQVKLAQPVRQLSRILQQEALERAIPMQKQVLGSALGDVRKRYDEARPRIELLQKQKQLLQERLQIQIDGCCEEVYQAALANAHALAGSVAGWVDAYTPKTKLGAVPSKLKARSVVKEITEHLAEQVEKHQNQWRNTVLQKLLEAGEEKIFVPARKDLDGMLGKLDSISDEVSGIRISKRKPRRDPAEAAASMLYVGAQTSAERAGVQSLSKQLATTAAVEVGAGVLLGLLGLFNPVTIGAMVIGTILVGAVTGQSNAMDKLKTEIVRQSQQQLRDQAVSFAQSVTADVRRRYEVRAEQLVGTLDAHIWELEDQFQLLIAEMEQGQEHIRGREATLLQTQKRIETMLIKLRRWSEEQIVP